MIIETILSDGLVKHESDANYKIRQIESGAIYSYAVDVIPCRYTYEETNIPIEDEDISNDELAKMLEGVL